MRITLHVEGKEIVITTDHAASRYGTPVVLVDGTLTDTPVEYQGDEPAPPTLLDLMADRAGVWGGAQTRRDLAALAVEMSGQPEEKIIKEFQRRGRSMAAAELGRIKSPARAKASAANGRKGGIKGGRPVTMTPQARAFADACHTNATDELETALAGPVDNTDCKTWKITPAQWRLAIKTALDEMRGV